MVIVFVHIENNGEFRLMKCGHLWTDTCIRDETNAFNISATWAGIALHEHFLKNLHMTR